MCDELTLPCTGSGRAGPTTIRKLAPHIWEFWPHPSPWVWGSWLCCSSERGSHSGPETNSAFTKDHIHGIQLTYPNIQPMCVWPAGAHNCFCGTIATRSPWLKATAGYVRGVLVMVKYWWCTESQWSSTRYTMSIVNKAVQTKEHTVWHPIAPNASKANEEMKGWWKRQRSEVILLMGSLCFVFVFSLFCSFF